jgi:predicted dehydrogenase
MKEKADKSQTGQPDPAAGSFGSFLDRRGFVRGGVAAGAGLALTSKSAIAQSESPDKVLKVALVGCGAQGQALMDSARTDDSLEGTFEMVAVCDIWETNRIRMSRTLQAYKLGPATPYVDIEEMLEKEQIDALLVATPDFMHAPHTIMGLEAGKAVYCEKMMSNTIEAAATMVKAQEKTGGVLQIGHQRRSNPRYLHARNNIVFGDRLLGRVTHSYGQWNRAVSEPYGWPKGSEMSAAELARWGYDSMEAFRNWRWFKKYGGGPISDLGAHQIDVFNWMFDSYPTRVIAAGGIDYYTEFELEDNVMAIYEYEIDGAKSRGYYQVLTTTSSQAFFEKFMGENGTLSISESEAVNQVYREARAPSWDPYAAKGLIVKDASKEPVYHKFWEQPKRWPGSHLPSRWLANTSTADVRETKGLDPWDLPIILDVRPHAPHIRNFLEAARKKDPAAVNCSVQTAYATCVTVLSAIKAIANGGTYTFKPDEFIA